MSLPHDRLELLDRYLRIPTISRQVTPEMTDVLGIPCLWIPAANSNNQQHDINEHYVLRHFYRQIELYAAIVSSRPM